jgi:DNA polymerase III alpha subunit
MKHGNLKYLFSFALILTIALSGFSVTLATEVTSEKIVTDKKAYDRKEVSVVGFVSNLKLKTLTGGNQYTTFVLVGESGGRINVFIWGRSNLQQGQKVRATGLYHTKMRAGNLTFNNVIEAKDVTKV